MGRGPGFRTDGLKSLLKAVPVPKAWVEGLKAGDTFCHVCLCLKTVCYNDNKADHLKVKELTL